jgi:hypothetical protein
VARVLAGERMVTDRVEEEGEQIVRALEEQRLVGQLSRAQTMLSLLQGADEVPTRRSGPNPGEVRLRPHLRRSQPFG